MKSFLKLALLSLAVACESPALAQAGALPGSRPNILLFYADDMGYHELGCYGNKDIRSPNIDSIAKNGIRFTQGYVSAPHAPDAAAPWNHGDFQDRTARRCRREQNSLEF